MVRANEEEAAIPRPAMVSIALGMGLGVLVAAAYVGVLWCLDQWVEFAIDLGLLLLLTFGFFGISSLLAAWSVRSVAGGLAFVAAVWISLFVVDVLFVGLLVDYLLVGWMIHSTLQFVLTFWVVSMLNDSAFTSSETPSPSIERPPEPVIRSSDGSVEDDSSTDPDRKTGLHAEFSGDASGTLHGEVPVEPDGGSVPATHPPATRFRVAQNCMRDAGAKPGAPSTRGIVLAAVFGLLPVVVGLGVTFLRPALRPARDIGPIHAVAFCPDGDRFVTGNQDGTVRLWSARTGENLRTYGDQRPAVTAVAVSGDNRYVLARWDSRSPQSHGMVMWDLETGEEARRFLGHSQIVNDVTFSPDSRHALSASFDRTVRVWNVRDGAEVLVLRGHQGAVNAVAVSPDGKRCLTGAGDYSGGDLHDPTMRLWDLASGEALRVFSGHTGSVKDVCFSPDGKTAASAAADNTIRIWDLETGADLQILRIANPGGGFNAVAFSPDGTFVLSGSGDWREGRVLLWNVATGQPVKQLHAGNPGHDVAFSPDGRFALSAHGYDASRPEGETAIMQNRIYVVDGVCIVWDAWLGLERRRVGARQQRE